MNKNDGSKVLHNKGRGYKIKKIEVRCANCNRKLFVGSPGMDYFREPKIIEIKCPRCGDINIIICRIEEKVIVRIKEK